MKKKIIKNKKIIIDIAFCLCILMYIMASLVKSFLKPIDEVERENRYAYKYEKININKFLNNDIQNNIENTLADQILISGKLKSANNYFKGTMINLYINQMLDENTNEYLYAVNVSFYGPKTLVFAPYNLDDYKENLNEMISNYNEIISKYKNVDFYAYYIEKDTDINFDTNKKMGAYEYIKANLSVKKISKFEINNIDDFRNYFYKTDHHWNYKGSYKGYKEVLNLLGIKNFKEYKYEVCLQDNFSGSKARTSIFNKVITETFCAYKFDYMPIDVTINGIKVEDYGQQMKYINKELDSKISYGDFYGWDEGEIIFDNHDNTKENILIFGESFDNAILKLVSENFNKTISIDLRNYEFYMKKKFNIDDYLKEYNIDKVLFIGNIGFYVSSDFILTEGK